MRSFSSLGAGAPFVADEGAGAAARVASAASRAAASIASVIFPAARSQVIAGRQYRALIDAFFTDFEELYGDLLSSDPCEFPGFRISIESALKNKVNNILSGRGLNLAKEALSSEKKLTEVVELPFDEIVRIELRVIVEQTRSLNKR